MYIDVSQRFTQVVKYLIDSRAIKNQAELTQILSLSKGYVSQLVNGQREPSGEVVSKLANSFPIINENWLLTGNGNMLLDSESQPQNPTVEQPEDRGMIEKMLLLVESQRKDIETLIELVKKKDEKIAELVQENMELNNEISLLKLDSLMRTHKGGIATDVGDSSSASAV